MREWPDYWTYFGPFAGGFTWHANKYGYSHTTKFQGRLRVYPRCTQVFTVVLPWP